MFEAALRNRWRHATRLYAAWPSTTILSGLCLLIAAEGELCVCELTTALEQSQP